MVSTSRNCTKSGWVWSLGAENEQQCQPPRRSSGCTTSRSGCASTEWLSEADRELIENSIYFFLATADADGRPDCSYKGGAPGFVRITGPDDLAFPDYDGNGMFKSLGNMAINPNVGLLFSASSARPAITRAKPKPKCGLWRVGIARCGSSGSSQHTRAPRWLRAGTSASRPWRGIKRAAAARGGNVADARPRGSNQPLFQNMQCACKIRRSPPFYSGYKIRRRVRNLGVTRPVASTLWHPPVWLSFARTTIRAAAVLRRESEGHPTHRKVVRISRRRPNLNEKETKNRGSLTHQIPAQSDRQQKFIFLTWSL